MVQDIFNKLGRSALPVPPRPVAMGYRMAPIRQALDGHSIVGVYGMGGAGKTTLANALFNQLQLRYPTQSCYVEVGQMSQRASDRLVLLEGRQQLMLHQLCRLTGQSFGHQQNRQKLQQCLAGSQVLLVLDDVWYEDQLMALLVPVSPGSKVIITTRDHGLLEQHLSNLCGSNTWTCLPVHELSEAQGRELFCLHAFKRPQAPANMEVLAAEAADMCGGLPLTLEVIGSFLANKKAELWPAACKRLRWAQSLDCSKGKERIFSRLRISFDDLDEDAQTMLMDIACVLLGERLLPAVAAWGDGAELRLQNVINLSLIKLKPSRFPGGGVTLDQRLIFDMHDQLRDMLRAMTSEQGSRYYRQYAWGINTNPASDTALQVSIHPCMHPADCLQGSFHNASFP